MTDAGNDERPGIPEQDAARIADYVEGRLTLPEREELERRVLADDAMSAALYAELNLRGVFREAAQRPLPHAGSAIRPQARETAPTPRRRIALLQLRVVLPLAASLVLLLFLLPRLVSQPQRKPPVLRGSGATVVGLAQSGDLAEPPARFTWTRDPLAESYRFRLFDGRARLLHDAVTSDTTYVLPAQAVAWEGVTEGYWIVVPQAGGAQGPASRPVRFRLIGL
jgi:hypothetical protein